MEGSTVVPIVGWMRGVIDHRMLSMHGDTFSQINIRCMTMCTYHLLLSSFNDRASDGVAPRCRLHACSHKSQSPPLS